MKKNKSNLAIVQDYLDGNRPFVQVGFAGNKNKWRKNGEKWKDKDGILWERKNGKNVKLTKSQADLIRELTRSQCSCGQDIKWGSKLDRYFFNRTGLCENCLIDYETKLRILGIYSDYEQYKLLSYELGTLQGVREQIVSAISYFSNDDSDVTMLCNSEGFTERWRNTNKDKIIEDAKIELDIVDKRISEVIKTKDESKNKYKENVKKYKLEYYA